MSDHTFDVLRRRLEAVGVVLIEGEFLRRDGTMSSYYLVNAERDNAVRLLREWHDTFPRTRARVRSDTITFLAALDQENGDVSQCADRLRVHRRPAPKGRSEFVFCLLPEKHEGMHHFAYDGEVREWTDDDKRRR